MESNTVKVGNKIIGGGFPIAIQTMWKTPLSTEIGKILKEIEELKDIGADIIRFAVPDIEDAEILSKISEKSPLPLVADIHFDYRIALKCIEGGVQKIRINQPFALAIARMSRVFVNCDFLRSLQAKLELVGS